MQIIAVCAGSAPRVHPALYLLLLLLTWGGPVILTLPRAAGRPVQAGTRSWQLEADSRGNLGRFGKQVVKEGNQ